jgi:hypothetical protein
VVQVADDAPLPAADGRLGVPAADPRRLEELEQRWGLGSSLRRMVAAITDPGR